VKMDIAAKAVSASALAANEPAGGNSRKRKAETQEPPPIEEDICKGVVRRAAAWRQKYNPSLPKRKLHVDSCGFHMLNRDGIACNGDRCDELTRQILHDGTDPEEAQRDNFVIRASGPDDPSRAFNIEVCSQHPYVMRIFRVATRLRSKVSPDRVTYVSKLTSVDPGTRIRLSFPETRTRDMDPSALAANHQNARASGALPQARPVLCPPPPSPPSPSSSQDALRPDASMFQIICEYIDKAERSSSASRFHLDDCERDFLKATAFRLSVSVSSHRTCKSAFKTGASEAVLTPSRVTRRRSLALAVLLTALGISAQTAFGSDAHGLLFVTPEMLARAIESDMTIRKMARNAQHSIVRFLYRNNLLWQSQGGHGP
jgi:hypothetical protein